MTCPLFMAGLLLFAANPQDAAAPEITNVREAPDLNSLFERQDGWIGGDGAVSVLLAPGRTLWLFSDTWVGKVRDGRRFDATIVNNTVAVQEASGNKAAVRFYIRRDPNNKPQAFLTPQNGPGWFWLQAATFDNQRLYVFLTQVERTNSPGSFGFRLAAQSLGVVGNPLETPTQWRVEQLKLPFAEFGSKHDVTFGAAVLQQHEFLYIYGVDDIPQALGRYKYMILARAPRASIFEFSTWQFFADGRWIRDSKKATRLVGGVANDYSVTYYPQLKCYVLVYTEYGLSSRILARTAPAPWGPWSEAALIYK